MSTFTFNGTYVTVGPVSGGFSQGYAGGNNRFSLSGSLGVGISITAFTVSVDCRCETFQAGDYIKLSGTTLFLATKIRVEYRLCGGQCNGTVTRWVPGLGLGISGTMRFTFG